MFFAPMGDPREVAEIYNRRVSCITVSKVDMMSGGDSRLVPMEGNGYSQLS